MRSRPNIMVWDKEEKLRTVEEIDCPTDINEQLKVSVKENTYAELLRNLLLRVKVYFYLKLLHP